MQPEPVRQKAHRFSLPGFNPNRQVLEVGYQTRNIEPG